MHRSRRASGKTITAIQSFRSSGETTTHRGKSLTLIPQQHRKKHQNQLNTIMNRGLHRRWRKKSLSFFPPKSYLRGLIFWINVIMAAQVCKWPGMTPAHGCMVNSLPSLSHSDRLAEALLCLSQCPSQLVLSPQQPLKSFIRL